MPKIGVNCHYCHFRMPINRAFVTVVAVVALKNFFVENGGVRRCCPNTSSLSIPLHIGFQHLLTEVRGCFCEIYKYLNLKTMSFQGVCGLQTMRLNATFTPFGAFKLRKLFIQTWEMVTWLQLWPWPFRTIAKRSWMRNFFWKTCNYKK